MAFVKIAMGLTVGLLAMLTASSAAALTMAFDDARFPANIDPYQFYPGVTITNTRLGTANQVVVGTGYGDPGNWDMAGTNGSVFLGTNLGTTVMTFAYDQVVTETTLDVGTPGDFFAASTPSTFTGTAFLGGSQVGVFTTTVNAGQRVADGPGFWETLTLTGVSFDSFTLSQVGFGAYGVDNVLIVADGVDKNLYLASRNLHKVDVRDVEGADPVSLIAYDKVMITVDAIKKFEETLA